MADYQMVLVAGETMIYALRFPLILLAIWYVSHHGGHDEILWTLTSLSWKVCSVGLHRQQCTIDMGSPLQHEHSQG